MESKINNSRNRERTPTVAVRSPIKNKAFTVTDVSISNKNIAQLFEDSLDEFDKYELMDEEETTAVNIDDADVELLQLLMK